ncbi:LysE family translocator [Streptomyces sp. TRM 70351]|uniref:LysE family translocator n=1 Tax=Streptomyces sp. TRM 70351 TaxID=3116552 RepID=UPI002E7BDD2F|nr:LysE family translocator [Streptomyces sp. TRM 70351]MEE1927864.1 LysE family translocator [Streptomyces sp. TRM 70351]
MSVNWPGFLGVVALAYLVPGPDFLVIARAATRSRRAGWRAALGAQTGLCVHMVAAALGLSVLLAQSATAFTTVRLAGAAYLVYLGVSTLRATRREAAAAGTAGRGTGGQEDAGAGAAGRESADGGAAAGRPGGRDGYGGFREGLLTNLLNPKAALFFLSILPQFLDPGAATAAQVLLLGAVDIAFGVAYWAGVVAVAAALSALLARPRARRLWERTTGWLFVGVGAALAAAGGF